MRCVDGRIGKSCDRCTAGDLSCFPHQFWPPDAVHAESHHNPREDPARPVSYDHTTHIRGLSLKKHGRTDATQVALVVKMSLLSIISKYGHQSPQPFETICNAVVSRLTLEKVNSIYSQWTLLEENRPGRIQMGDDRYIGPLEKAAAGNCKASSDIVLC